MLPNRYFVRTSCYARFSARAADVTIIVLQFSTITSYFYDFEVRDTFGLYVPIGGATNVYRLVVSVSYAEGSLNGVDDVDYGLEDGSSLLYVFSVEGDGVLDQYCVTRRKDAIRYYGDSASHKDSVIVSEDGVYGSESGCVR